MKSLTFKILFVLTAFVLITGCKKKFEDYSVNDNLPVQVPPGLILPTILNDMFVSPGGNEDKADQYIVSNYNYYGDNKYWNGSATLNFGTLRNVLAMEKQAFRLAGTDQNPYHALGLFFRAFFYVNMTEKVGDLPLSEALQGIDNPTPKYDTQKEIFRQSLAWLDTANTLLTSLINTGFLEFSGDTYFNPGNDGTQAQNSLIHWRKVVNSYQLRVLIELSKKADDPDLNVKGRFAAIVGNPSQYPIFTSNADNLQYTYNSTYNYYPDNPQNYGNNAGRLNIASTVLNTLSSLKDIRAMVFAEPARALGFADTDYRSYAGGKSGDDVSILSTLSGAGSISLYNYHHFYSTFTAEPTLILSYAEVCYCIAEGINRGWGAGDAETWYVNGTKAMFDFYGIVDGVNHIVLQANGGGDLNYDVTFNFADYFAQPLVKYKGDNSDGLKQILIEKYLAYFRNSGLQAYYQWRRTGVPDFSVGAGTGNGGVIPRRFQYPTNEASVNGDNLQAALQSQFGGSDEIDQDLWLVK